jgi:hypothetical protein
LNIHRQTAASYLDELSEGGLLKKEKIGKNNYFINEPLFLLFKNFDFVYEFGEYEKEVIPHVGIFTMKWRKIEKGTAKS